MSRPQRPKRVRAAIVVGGLALLTLMFAQLGPARILSLLSSLGVNFLVIVSVFACHESVRALAVGRFLPEERRPPFPVRLRIRFLGEAVGTVTRTGMFGAEPTRAWMLAGQTGFGSRAYAASASELVANSCMSACVTVAVAAYMICAIDLKGPLLVLAHILFWSSLVYVCAAVGAVAARVHVIGAILRGVSTLPFIGRHLATDPLRVRSIEDAIIQALTRRPSALAQVMALEFVAQVILVFEIYWTIRSMGIAVDASHALFVEVVTKAANVIQVIGVTEAGYAVVFNWLGMTATVGFTLSLVKMLRSLTAAGIGLTVLNLLDRRWQTMIAASGCQ